jgi:quercetin dioxygenase-like cupin family protein
MKFAPGAAGVTTNATNAVLSGPLDKPAPYVLRVRLGPGGQVSPHTHPDTRYVTVLSGEYSAGKGDTVSPANETELPVGSYMVIPAGVPHYSIARKGEAVYQEYGVGPTATNFIKK